MYSANANYLTNPNKLSTRVHYAPGGASSLSLGWEENPPRQRSTSNNAQITRIATQQPNYRQNQQINSYNPIFNEDKHGYYPQKNYIQPQNKGINRVNQSNKLLQEQLKYYQNRNKFLKQNTGQQYNNPVQNHQHMPKNAQYNYPTSILPPKPTNYGYSQQQSNINYRRQQLDRAIYEQNQKRNYQKQENTNPYQKQYVGYQGQQKTSVRVNNPPGGKSNIIFG